MPWIREATGSRQDSTLINHHVTGGGSAVKRPAKFGLAAVAAAAALTIAACGGSSGGGSGSGSGGGSSTSASFNQGVTKVVHPSSATGGTITYADSSTPDSFDPGNTYYAWVLNFNRLYATPLVTFKSCPGTCGDQIVPGLATSLGQVSDNGLTWTYHLKQGITYQDGTPVTSADVKYAVERTFDRSVLANGPSYYPVLLKGGSKYPGPYKDKSKAGLSSITTPDKYTIQFHLASPYPDFNYVVAFSNSAPVPQAKDTGTNYQLHVQSTGPYMFQSYQLNKQLTLVKNPKYKASWDTQAKQLANKIVIDLNVNANDLDNRLMAGDIQVDAAGTGVQAAARAKILSSNSLKQDSDDPLAGFLWFIYLNTKVAPMNNLNCRIAVEYAANKTELQTAYGGPVAGGQIASTTLIPDQIGYKKFDLYEATTQPSGDLTKAKAALKACGQPSGFTTGMAYRSDRPKEVQAAQALQSSLARVGIKLQLHGYPSGNYYSNFAGVPKFVHTHDLGIDIGGWAADWPNGNGMLDELVNGNTIVSAGNTNISELNDPVINNLFTKANSENGDTRNAIWTQIDHQVMKDAAILPEVYAKSLIYRSPDLTNVYVQPQYGMYNYIALGTTSKS
jgi:peptide/nickel transport system substrate-binding protein